MNHSIKVTLREGKEIEVLIDAKDSNEAMEKFNKLKHEALQINVSTLPEGKLLPEHAFQVLYGVIDENPKEKFTSFCEVHYSIIEHILDMRIQPVESQPVNFVEYYDNGGTGMLMEAARILALKFEKEYSETEWGVGDMDFYDTLEQFMQAVNWEDI